MKTASLGSNFTGSYIKKCTHYKVLHTTPLNKQAISALNLYLKTVNICKISSLLKIYII